MAVTRVRQQGGVIDFMNVITASGSWTRLHRSPCYYQPNYTPPWAICMFTKWY